MLRRCWVAPTVKRIRECIVLLCTKNRDTVFSLPGSKLKGKTENTPCYPGPELERLKGTNEQICN